MKTKAAFGLSSNAAPSWFLQKSMWICNRHRIRTSRATINSSSLCISIPSTLYMIADKRHHKRIPLPPSRPDIYMMFEEAISVGVHIYKGMPIGRGHHNSSTLPHRVQTSLEVLIDWLNSRAKKSYLVGFTFRRQPSSGLGHLTPMVMNLKKSAGHD